MKVVLANTQQNQGFEDNMSNLTTEATSASPTPIPAAKKKRSLPGNPDPDAEVVALSPGSLMATNRFMCEVCHKGFQREQNLQLHRRGHNLPWKLKQRSSNNDNDNVVVPPRKKVYVCPEASCVHHHPSRALGDLTGIKKHFSRKHGEKKYKCDKCSKKYAVQSDWKAHSKTCGTREYKCDCGTIFSRRDSFITHRAFCDALAEESAKAIPQSNPYPLLFDQQHFSSITPEMIPSSTWLPTPTSICHTTTTEQMYSHKIENPSPLPLQLASYQANSASPHLSATALLQKAAQMGATMSRQADHHNSQMAAHSTSNNTGFSHGSTTTTTTTTPPTTLQEVMMMAPLSYDERECVLEMAGSTSKRDQDFVTTTSAKEGGGDGLTRDFLGPRAFSHMDILGMAAAGLPNYMTTTSSSSSSFQQCQHNNSKPWHDMRSYHHEKYDVSSEFHI